MQGSPIRVTGIDIEVQIVFRSEHIPLILPQFDKVGISPAIMDELINAYIASGEQVPYERWFLEYGQNKINPLMNQKLKRAANHPTFNNLLKFALKEVIDQHPTIIVMRKAKEVVGQKAK